MLIAATAVVAASAVGFGLPLLDGDRSGGDKSGGEIFLQAAGAPDRDPFTLSTAQEPMGVETPPAARAGPTADTNRTGYVQVTGAHPGLYGGTQSVASCDVEKQITFLTQNSDKGKAFAGALGVQ